MTKSIPPTSSKPEASSPVVISFVDTDDHVNRDLTKLKEMAAHRLIVREDVVLEQGSLD